VLAQAQAPLDARAKMRPLAGELRSLAGQVTAQQTDAKRRASLAVILRAMAERLD
jgi:hypothetical protein